MKKFLSAILISSLLLSFTACGSNDSAEDAASEETVAASEEAAETEESAETADTGETADEDAGTVENADESKKVYWATEDKDPSDVSYHKEDCSLIKDKSPEELSWEIINTLGMPACEVCKP